MYVTYSDLIQFGIFVVTFAGVCHAIMQRKGK